MLYVPAVDDVAEGQVHPPLEVLPVELAALLQSQGEGGPALGGTTGRHLGLAQDEQRFGFLEEVAPRAGARQDVGQDVMGLLDPALAQVGITERAAQVEFELGNPRGQQGEPAFGRGLRLAEVIAS
ncbi:hypothetical protein ACFSTC_59885 [Nonomuraea ferruginea]